MQKVSEILKLTIFSAVLGALVYGATLLINTVNWSGGMDFGPNILLFPFYVGTIFLTYGLSMFALNRYLAQSRLVRTPYIFVFTSLIIFVKFAEVLYSNQPAFLILLYPLTATGHALLFEYLVPPIKQIAYSLRAVLVWALSVLVLVLLFN